MSVFFTADTHFGHKNICKIAGRPFASVEEMDEALIANWNAVVGEDDTAYHLGDFSFSGTQRTLDIIARLNGDLRMVLGNHDGKNMYAAFDQDLLGDYADILELKHEGELMILFHYPMRQWNKCHYGSWHLHGHTHGSIERLGKSLDVGVDCHGYAPVSFERVKELMRGRENVGHHGAVEVLKAEKDGGK